MSTGEWDLKIVWISTYIGPEDMRQEEYIQSCPLGGLAR